jgi:hypothetical protein
LVDSVGEQSAVSGEFRCRINRGYVVSGGGHYDLRAMRERKYIRWDDQAAFRLARKRDDGRFDFYVSMNGRNDWHVVPYIRDEEILDSIKTHVLKKVARIGRFWRFTWRVRCERHKWFCRSS